MTKELTNEDLKRLVKKHGAKFEIHLQASPRVARVIVALNGSNPPHPSMDFPISGSDTDEEVFHQLRLATIQTGLASETDTFAYISFNDEGQPN
jgi:hypothetical protein